MIVRITFWERYQGNERLAIREVECPNRLHAEGFGMRPPFGVMTDQFKARMILRPCHFKERA